MFVVALPILIIVHFLSLKYTRRKALNFANFEIIERVTGKKLMSKNISLLVLRFIILCFLIFAAAGTTYWYTGKGSNFDYALLIDGSVSMLATDYDPDRINAAKNAALDFVNSFSGEVKIAVATFTGTTFVKQKLTSDKGDIRNAINKIGVEEIGGTAIGDAMVTASNLLFEKKEGNVLVLLTDGQSNVGLGPEDAITYLNDKKILVNTIGIGTPMGASFVEGSDIVSRLNEDTLKRIASETGGKYFRAEDPNKLKKAFSDIAQSKTKRLSKDLTISFMIIGLTLLLLEWSSMNTKYRSITSAFFANIGISFCDITFPEDAFIFVFSVLKEDVRKIRFQIVLFFIVCTVIIFLITSSGDLIKFNASSSSIFISFKLNSCKSLLSLNNSCSSDFSFCDGVKIVKLFFSGL